MSTDKVGTSEKIGHCQTLMDAILGLMADSLP